MTDSSGAAPKRAFEDHDAYRPADGDDEADYRLTTTAFEGVVSLPEDRAGEPAADGRGTGEGDTYSLVVETPTLEAATSDPVGSAVAVGWFETLQKRLDDAPAATRHDVSLSGFGVAEDGDVVVIRYEFAADDPAVAASVAKTFAEYVEGTYVEGVVPGYEYEGTVAELIGAAAAGGGDGEIGGTPL